jgi:EAL domain-containing protein (putative c-di-GMP-specific phosphodiesterase class I)
LHADDAATLLQRADVAMYDAKVNHATVAPYRAASDVNTPERLQLLADLRQALSGGTDLRLDYQPIVDVRSRKVLGVEALLRWDHPVRGLIGPTDFVGTAERTGLIRPLTRWVLDEAIGQCRRWLDEGLRLTVAVNLSARNLAEPDLPSAVSALLAKHQVPAELLVLEITESAVIDEPDQAEHVVRRLVDLGLGMSLDDFGTGYSSMATLMQLPLRSLKVDRSFVNGLDRFAEDGGESRGAVITRATVAMAQQLGLSVVAEGVETDAQLTQLRNLGCNAAQGFLLSRPTGAAEVTAYVRATATLRPSGGRRRGPA